jgi:hypothetical protein
MLMKYILALLLLAFFGAPLGLALAATNSPSADRDLIIAPSAMRVAAGKATLSIGVLQRTNGSYTGAYTMKVAPYFYKSEHGTLKIIVSDESLAKLGRGTVATITGTATTSGTNGKTRHIDATATPENGDRGKLKLWFLSGERKMIFEPTYEFRDNRLPPAPVAQSTLNPTLKPAAPLQRTAESKRP